jgi:hypothetical protein
MTSIWRIASATVFSPAPTFWVLPGSIYTEPTCPESGPLGKQMRSGFLNNLVYAPVNGVQIRCLLPDPLHDGFNL